MMKMSTSGSEELDMDKAKQKALEAAGWRVGDAADFLGLTEEERREVDLRAALSRAIRRRSEQSGLTRKQLAARLKLSPSKMASLDVGVEHSLDFMFHVLFALGGEIDDVVKGSKKSSRKHVTRS